jgi:acetyl-CoA C-acetyltransferase
MLKNVMLAGGVRTPFGSFNGALAEVPAARLGSVAIKAALERAHVKAGDVDEVIFGNVIQAGHGQNIARQASLGAGIGLEVGCATINKVCGSSMRAVISAAQAIQCDDAQVVVAGGTESMTRAPYLLDKARGGYRMGDGRLIDAMIHDGLWDVYKDKHMGMCGDLCAAKYNITRQAQDAYAIESFRRYFAAAQQGFFKEFVVPVEIQTRKGTVVVDTDEDPTHFDEAKVTTLKPAFGAGGTVTAANASKITDGAAALLVLSEERCKALGVKPQARILGHANYATEPDWFTIAPIHAIRKLSEKLNLKLADVDLFEINEAFAVVALVTMRELGLPHEKVNVNGGAVAIGHPIGATGARIIITLLQALKRRGGKRGVACLCIGGGEASAIAIERVDV